MKIPIFNSLYTNTKKTIKSQDIFPSESVSTILNLLIKKDFQFLESLHF